MTQFDLSLSLDFHFLTANEIFESMMVFCEYYAETGLN